MLSPLSREASVGMLFTKATLPSHSSPSVWKGEPLSLGAAMTFVTCASATARSVLSKRRKYSHATFY